VSDLLSSPDHEDEVNIQWLFLFMKGVKLDLTVVPDRDYEKHSVSIKEQMIAEGNKWT